MGPPESEPPLPVAPALLVEAPPVPEELPAVPELGVHLLHEAKHESASQDCVHQPY